MDELTEVHEYAIDREEQFGGAMRCIEREGRRYLEYLTGRAEEEKERSQAQTCALATVLANTAELGKERYQVAGGICSGMFRYDEDATSSFIGVLCAARERGRLSEEMAWDLGLCHARACGYAPSGWLNDHASEHLYKEIRPYRK